MLNHFKIIKKAWFDGWMYKTPPPSIPIHELDLLKAYQLHIDALHERRLRLQAVFDIEKDKLKKSKIGCELTNILVKIANIEKRIDAIYKKYQL